MFGDECVAGIGAANTVVAELHTPDRVTRHGRKTTVGRTVKAKKAEKQPQEALIVKGFMAGVRKWSVQVSGGERRCQGTRNELGSCHFL